jgi:hypothetical protein
MKEKRRNDIPLTQKPEDLREKKIRNENENENENKKERPFSAKL